MMKLAPENLRLTAMYGLIIAASVICFGASVGNWIDKTRRITGKRIVILLLRYLSWQIYHFRQKKSIIQFLLFQLQGHS